MKGSDALMEMLRAEGVKYIFGNPGTSEAAIMDSLENYPEFEYILAVQESVAIGMADTYARATGKPAFVSLHIDNGLSNSFALLIDSYNTGTPMVVTAGNKDVRKLAEGRSDPRGDGAAVHEVERRNHTSLSSTRQLSAGRSTKRRAPRPALSSCRFRLILWTTMRM